MRYTRPFLNRRARKRLYAVAAGLSLALWLVLTVAEAYSPLHAWLHGGSIPDNDDCGVVALVHGKVDTAVPVVFVTEPVTWVEIVPRAEVSVFLPIPQWLPAGRGPPVSTVVS